MFKLIDYLNYLAIRDFTSPINDRYVEDLLVTVVDKWVFPVSGLIAAAFLVYGGIQYMTAAGAEDKIKTAVKTITGAIIGLVVVMAAVAIRETVFRAIQKPDLFPASS